MALEDIVRLVISRESKTVTKPGFGVPLLAVGKVPATWGANLVREFTSLTEMTDAGFVASDPAMRMATAMKSQDPSVAKWKIAKRKASTPKAVLTISNSPPPAQGDKYAVSVGGAEVVYTAGSSPTPTTVATGLSALILGSTGWTSVAGAGIITLTGVAGSAPELSGWSDNVSVLDTTVDPGLADDLSAFVQQEPNWYGLLIDSSGADEIEAAAAWTEANKKLFIANTSDSEVADQAIDDDIVSTLKLSSYFRTAVIYSHKNLHSFAAEGWVGNRFPYDPGQAPDAGGTWAYKTLQGVPASVMPGGASNAVINKNGNVYTIVSGAAITQYGKTAGGEWIDVIRFIDWLEAEIKARVFLLLINSQRVPFTDNGIGLIVAQITGALQDGVTAGGLAPKSADEPGPKVLAPKALQVSTLDRANRNLPGVTFTARLAGAIHTVNISGTVSV